MKTGPATESRTDPSQAPSAPRTSQNSGTELPPIDESIQEVSRYVPSDLLGKRGIQKIRVLSESKFEDLLTRLVESRLGDSLAVTRLPDPKPGEDSDGDASKDSDALKRENAALKSDYEETWKAYRASREEALDDVESRMRSLHGKLQGLGNTLHGMLALLERTTKKRQV